MLLNYTASVFSVLSTTLAYRHLSLFMSEEDSKVVLYVWMLVMLFSLFELGLSRGLAYHYNFSFFNRDETTVLGLVSAVIMGVVAGVCALAYAFLSEVLFALENEISIWLGLLVMLSVSNSILGSLLDLFKNFYVGFVFKIFNNSMFWVIVLLMNGASSPGVLLRDQTLVRMSVFFLLMVYLISRLSSKNVLMAYHIRFWILMKYSQWTGLSTILGSLVSYLDRFLLLSNGSTLAFNMYSSVSDVTQKGISVTSIMANSMLPFLKGGIDDIKTRKRASNLLIVFAVLVVLILVIFGKRITMLIFPGFSNFSDLYYTFVVLIMGVIILGFSQQILVKLHGYGLAKEVSIAHLAIFILYFIFIQYFPFQVSALSMSLLWSTRIAIDLVVLSILNYFYENR